MRQATAICIVVATHGASVTSNSTRGTAPCSACVVCVQYVLAYCDPFALKPLLGDTTLAMPNQYVAAV